MTTDRKKQQAVEHICYEISRLRESYERMRVVCRSTDQQAKNDLLELILVHSRAVLDFLECSRSGSAWRPKKAFPTDIVSEDFAFAAQPVPIAKTVKKRIDTEIAHLTYERCGLTRAQKKWEFDAFVPVLLRSSKAFLQHLAAQSKVRLDPSDRSRITRCLSRLSTY